MTTLAKNIVVCAVCLTENTVTTIQSIYAGSRTGLDGRPPTLPRNLVALTIQQCRACGYCAPNLASADELGNPDVTALGYRRLLVKDDFYPAARGFRCYAYLAERAANYKVACWALLNAVWVCDDRGGRRGKRAAKRFRDDLLVALDDLHARGQQLLPYDNFDALLRLDLRRRTGQFSSVVESCSHGVSQSHPRFHARIVSFQKFLASRSDAFGYYIEQALAGTGDRRCTAEAPDRERQLYQQRLHPDDRRSLER